MVGAWGVKEGAEPGIPVQQYMKCGSGSDLLMWKKGSTVSKRYPTPGVICIIQGYHHFCSPQFRVVDSSLRIPSQKILVSDTAGAPARIIVAKRWSNVKPKCKNTPPFRNEKGRSYRKGGCGESVTCVNTDRGQSVRKLWPNNPHLFSTDTYPGSSLPPSHCQLSLESLNKTKVMPFLSLSFPLWTVRAPRKANEQHHRWGHHALPNTLGDVDVRALFPSSFSSFSKQPKL